MPFLKNNQYKEIYEASKNGNQKAMEIIQALRGNGTQDDLDRMVASYYDVGGIEPLTIEQASTPISEPLNEGQDQIAIEELEEPVEPVDLSSALDKDFEDILDENDIDDTPFSDFLKHKHRDSERARKNSDYFKAYSPEDREKYLTSKVDSYKNKFNNRLKDIDRRYRDMDGAIGIYSQRMNELLDDKNELDTSVVNNAYNDITGNEDIMHGFGRSWDEQDTASVLEALEELTAKYGKKNIIAALNTLRSDNSNYKDYLNNQVDSEIGRYSKSIENLLK